MTLAQMRAIAATLDPELVDAELGIPRLAGAGGSWLLHIPETSLSVEGTNKATFNFGALQGRGFNLNPETTGAQSQFEPQKLERWEFVNLHIPIAVWMFKNADAVTPVILCELYIFRNKDLVFQASQEQKTLTNNSLSPESVVANYTFNADLYNAITLESGQSFSITIRASTIATLTGSESIVVRIGQQLRGTIFVPVDATMAYNNRTLTGHRAI